MQPLCQGGVSLPAEFVRAPGRNSRRIMLSSGLDGATFPVDSQAVQGAAATIAATVARAVEPVDLIIGFAGRGIIPAFALGLKLSRPVQIAYKNRLDLTPEIRFIESEAENKALYFYPSLDAANSTVLLVDDEITTGSTFISAAAALEESGFRIAAVCAFIEVTGFAGRANVERAGYSLLSAGSVGGAAAAMETLGGSAGGDPSQPKT
jgi:adenine/guanine phosphoribosyltransferase-like PRPP-binding protein